MNFGKAVPAYKGSQKRVTFDDVAGADEEKAELAEIVDFLKDPQKYIELGAHSQGILLFMGTGKTLLGRAVAGRPGAVFSISGSDLWRCLGIGASG